MSERTADALDGSSENGEGSRPKTERNEIGVDEVEDRRRSETLLRSVEEGFYLAVAGALALGGLALFVHSIFRFVVRATEGPFVQHVLEFLDGLLLVFIVAELLHTVRALLHKNVLATEPFLIIGIVAAIRRLLVISAEAPDFLGEASFRDLMLEMGILIAAVLALGLTIVLLRRSETR